MPKIKLNKPRTGYLVGYHKIVIAVNQDRTDAYAFEGSYMPDGRAVEVAAGTVMVEKRDDIHHDPEPDRRFKWRVGTTRQDAEGVFAFVDWSEEYDEVHFVEFRDKVAALVRKAISAYDQGVIDAIATPHATEEIEARLEIDEDYRQGWHDGRPERLRRLRRTGAAVIATDPTRPDGWCRWGRDTE